MALPDLFPETGSTCLSGELMMELAERPHHVRATASGPRSARRIAVSSDLRPVTWRCSRHQCALVHRLAETQRDSLPATALQRHP